MLKALMPFFMIPIPTSVFGIIHSNSYMGININNTETHKSLGHPSTESESAMK